MAQFGRPISDLQNTSITGGYIDIDEISFSDTDYLYSADNVDTTYECGLTASLEDPILSSGHTFNYRIAEIDGGVLGDGAGSIASVIVSLYQGATLIASDTSRNGSNAWTSYSYTLTGGETDTISNYTDLRLVFTITGGGGGPTSRRGIGVSWAELEIPTVPPQTYEVSITLTSDNLLSGTTTHDMVDILSLTSDNLVVGAESALIIDDVVTLTSDNTVSIIGGLEYDKDITLTSDNSLSGSTYVDFSSTLILTSNNLLSGNTIHDMVDSISLTSDNSLSDQDLANLLSDLSLSSNTTDIYNVGVIIDKNIIITSDNILTSEAFVSKNYNVEIQLNSLIEILTSGRTSEKLTLRNIGSIKNIGTIK